MAKAILTAGVAIAAIFIGMRIGTVLRARVGSVGV